MQEFGKFRHTVGIALLVGIFVSHAIMIFASERLQIRVTDSRPLAAALLILEARTGIPITYEDPVYLYPEDLSVNPYSRSSQILVPRIRTLDFHYQRDSGLCQIIKSLAESYNAERTAAEFHVRKEEQFFHVFPTKSRDAEGKWVSHTSVLDTEVTLSLRDVTGVAVLDAIMNLVSKRLGKKIFLGRIPQPVFASLKYKKYSAVELPARSHLMTLVRDSRAQLSWQILCGGNRGIGCALNIHEVGDLSYLGHNAIDSVGQTGYKEGVVDECIDEHRAQEFVQDRLLDEYPVQLASDMTKPELRMGGVSDFLNIPGIQGVSGTLALSLTISSSGEVNEVRVLRSIGSIDGAVVDVVKNWRYTPAVYNGRPITVYCVEILRFSNGVAQRLT